MLLVKTDYYYLDTFLKSIWFYTECVKNHVLCMALLICAVQLDSCRKTQYAFDKCMLEKLGIERPFVGYFSKVRVHHTNRPKPEVHVEMPEPLHKHPTYDPKDPVPEVTKKRASEFI